MRVALFDTHRYHRDDFLAASAAGQHEICFLRVREWNFSLAGLVGFDLHGTTVGIVGTGRIGQVATRIFR